MRYTLVTVNETEEATMLLTIDGITYHINDSFEYPQMVYQALAMLS